MTNNKLIFDIGFHKCEDIAYFLHLGYKVVGCDADPKMVAHAKEIFAGHNTSGQLQVHNFAVSYNDNETVPFNVSEFTLWNSLRPEVAGRDQKKTEVIQVPTRRLDTLMNEHGVPYYCKIDIEGYDAVAVNTLKDSSHRPEFISVETECIGDSEIISDEKALETLTSLHACGYNKFKLIDQVTLEVLKHEPFYGKARPAPQYKERSLLDKILRRPAELIKPESHFDQLRRIHEYNFPTSSTGPFGNDLEGEWIGFDAAKEMLLYHRRMFFANKNVNNYSFWCDWHAMRG